MNRGRDRGFALLIVLWSLVLIALLTTQIIAAGRTAATLAANMRQAADARARADGAIYEAIYYLLAGGAAQWVPDGTTHHMQGNNGVVIAVRAESLADRINPNKASTSLLTGLWQACGAAPAQAQSLAQAVIGWRAPAQSKRDTQALLTAYSHAGLPYAPPGQPFADLSELADVIDMPPALLACAMPVLSLYQDGDPDPRQSGPLVRRALQLSGQSNTGNGYNGTSPTVAIDAEIVALGGIHVRREAMVSLAGADAPVPFKILSLADIPLQ